ncbi:MULTISPECIES: chemotaxis protein CheW [Spongiibacter]|uniref:chemotaxis protein CheW n=1 Tax=Spongiibacter TaxID=630749 RepID=UPI000C596CD1|nr:MULTISPECIES: chemotaxis protein CheW [Spongiibacter]MAY38139.1 chemotaxis protein CheW [Spongiibacter sp.]MBI59365.1 chemotaxis protein CheW [Spongiibacter sp.]MBO6751604.1 purine-binding chemotaxis protein CheW [Spongiibacter sp.]|tara:strand:- start:200 stop:739 length:540 start_codon:yes stop_codon:yes gene_type:complete
MSAADPAFQYLVDLARRSRRDAGELSVSKESSESLWSGIGFAVGNQYCVVPMGEIAEVMSEPPTTRLPGVKSWIKGVANVRGRLLPLMDLSAFLDNSVTGARHQRRVMVLERGDIYIGLVVDDVFGMQHFQTDAYSETADVPDALQRFVGGSYRQGSRQWALFRPLKLMEVRDFYDVAI